jgi:transcriptional regulator GlxA family with amidase domain
MHRRKIHVARDSDTRLYVKQFGFEDILERSRWGPGRRNDYLLHYVIEGKGYFNGNPVGENQGFLIRPNQLIEYIFDKNTPWRYYWIVFNGEYVENHLKEYGFDEDTQIMTNSSHPKIIDFLDHIFRTSGDNVPANFARCCLSILLSYQDKHTLPSDSTNGTITRLHVEKAVEYMHLNYCHPINISEVSKFVNLDSQYLYNIFKKHLHVSPKTYLNNIRMTKAKEMLLNTSHSVVEIAHSVGYNDGFQFSNFFKKQTGLAPNHYRREQP